MVNEELKGKEIMDDELDEAVGGKATINVASEKGKYVIKIAYSATTNRAEIRKALIREMEKLSIPTDKVPDMYALWRRGMTIGPQAGTLVYECRADGNLFRCYQG